MLVTNAKNVYDNFLSKPSAQICPYLNPLSPTLGAKKGLLWI